MYRERRIREHQHAAVVHSPREDLDLLLITAFTSVLALAAICFSLYA